MDRTEWEQRHTDHVEEAQLAVLDRQIALHGIWRDSSEGCPHLHKQKDYPATCDDPDLCDDRAMTPCIYELHREPDEYCETFRDIIMEWQREINPTITEELIERAAEDAQIVLTPEEITAETAAQNGEDWDGEPVTECPKCGRNMGIDTDADAPYRSCRYQDCDNIDTYPISN